MDGLRGADRRRTAKRIEPKRSQPRSIFGPRTSKGMPHKFGTIKCVGARRLSETRSGVRHLAAEFAPLTVAAIVRPTATCDLQPLCTRFATQQFRFRTSSTCPSFPCFEVLVSVGSFFFFFCLPVIVVVSAAAHRTAHPVSSLYSSSHSCLTAWKNVVKQCGQELPDLPWHVTGTRQSSRGQFRNLRFHLTSTSCEENALFKPI